jgi:hypothetical protein
VTIFFSSGLDTAVVAELKGRMSQDPIHLTSMTDGSTRAAGDSLEARIKKELPGILAGTGYEYRGDFGRKAMQDLEFFRGDSRYLVDVKSWRRGTIWGAPNLTSVARLADLYEDPNAFFTPLIVHYSVCDGILVNLDFQFLLIEWIDWTSLKIGALGKGQIQIKDSADKLATTRGRLRTSWLEDLYTRTLQFYDAEKHRIDERAHDFQSRLAVLRSGQATDHLPTNIEVV